MTINSNGLLLNKKNVDRILDTWLGEISFSLDAATPETYQKIRGADFEKALDNMRYLISERNRRGREKPMVSMNMTLMRENIEEAVAFIELAHELGAHQAQFWHLNALQPNEVWNVSRVGWTFDYREQMLSNYPELSNQMIRSAIKRAEELGMRLYLDWAKTVYFDEDANDKTPSEEEVSKGDDSEPTEIASPSGCSSPWNWMLIQTDGTIKPCCFGPGLSAI